MASKKTSKLPFVVQPRLQPIKEIVGTPESGQIEIERRGYLTVGEKAFSQAVSSGDESVAGVFTLVSRISASTGFTSEQIFADLQSGSDAEYLAPYRDELSEKVLAMAAFQERLKLVSATALLMSRVDASWTPQETMELHPDLVDALASLYNDEEKKCVDAFTPEKTEASEAAGKE